MEQFLSDHSVDIFLPNEKNPESCQALNVANYVFHGTVLPTAGGIIANPVCRGVELYAVPLSCLQHLEATAIHLVLATKSEQLVAAYLSPTRTLIDSDLTE
jgi:hypothetical protein